ncbi:MAG: hypothetical protein HYV45_02585 [Candidatus Moranbacteria bacterium]|nr:hypothetical protein [Candidatus Moranbacteria bacterium]
MEPVKMEEDTTSPSSCSSGQCPECEKSAQEARENEEMSMAFLLALMPVISLTFFGQVGLL